MFKTPIPDNILATLDVNNRNVKCIINGDEFTLTIVESGIPKVYQILQHNDSFWNALVNKTSTFPFNSMETEFNRYYISQNNHIFKADDIEKAKEILAQEIFDDLKIQAKNIKIDWQYIFDTMAKLPDEDYWNPTKKIPEQYFFIKFHRTQQYFYKNLSKDEAVKTFIMEDFFNKDNYYMKSYDEELERICLLWLTNQIATINAIKEIYELVADCEKHDSHRLQPKKYKVDNIIQNATKQYLAIYEFYQNHTNNYQKYKELYQRLAQSNAKTLNLKLINDNKIYKIYRENIFKGIGWISEDIHKNLIFEDPRYQFLDNVEYIKYRGKYIYQK